MTSSVIRKYVLAALCGAAIVGVGQSAQAATWDIIGGVAPTGARQLRHLPPDQNNVINQSTSVWRSVFDKCPDGASIFAECKSKRRHSSAVYNVAVVLSWVRIRQYQFDFAATGVALARGILDRKLTPTTTASGCLLVLRRKSAPYSWEQPPIKPLSLLCLAFATSTDGSNVVNGFNPGLG